MRLVSGTSDEDIQQRKEFSSWVLSVGDETIDKDNGEDIKIQVPNDLLLSRIVNPMSYIVSIMYP